MLCQTKSIGSPILGCLLVLALSGAAGAWQAPAGDNEQRAAAPQLRLDAGGPTSFVSALAFHPRGDRLYLGGFDKLVDAWHVVENGGVWQRDAAGAFRVPIGPETWGAVNAVAVSHDGAQVAVGGKALARGVGDWQHPGWVIPSVGLIDESGDRGTIYLFDARTRQARQLRGHRGAVLALTYAAGPPNMPRCLVSAAAEPDPRDGGKWSIVARIWDADNGRHLGAGKMTPCPRGGGFRPALAAWRFGAGPRQIAVAAATGESLTRGKEDYRLCLLNLETGQRHDAPDGEYNYSVAYWPSTRQLVTGGKNSLTLWSVAAANRRPTRLRTLDLRRAAANKPRLVVPQAIAIFSSLPGGQADRAAVVSRFVFAGEEDRLQRIDLAAFQQVGEDALLWRDGKTPALAASPDGRHLAVTGGKNHEVFLYRANELGRQRLAPRQVLRSQAERFGYAAFVRNGERPGLLLAKADAARKPGQAPREPAADDVVLDADRREVSRQIDGWRISRPDVAGWQVESGTASKPTPRKYLRVRRGQRLGAAIWLPPGHELSDYALLPPGDGRPAPFLAVATHELGEPSLYLYDADSGQRFRRLSGHVERLRSLAFDAAGTMLVSTGDDQMVCVWSLADWRECLGVRGWLPGLAVERRGNRLTAVAAESVEPIAAGQFMPGDAIEAIIEAGRRQPLALPYDFYSSVLRHKPGETITLVSARGNGPARQVRLTLSQATDQRLPLFSFIGLRRAADEDENNGAYDWLGWSPSGVYDASRPEAEERIGWHFNTGRPEAPVRFALAAEYARLRQPGLLKELLRHPDQPPRPPDDMPPKLSVWLAPNGAETAASERIWDVAAGAIPLADANVTLHACVNGLEPHLIRSVAWREPGGPSQAMQPIESSSREFADDLSGQPWTRGERTIECLVETNELEPRTLKRQLRLQFSPPPAPTIKSVMPGQIASRSQEKRLRFHAELQAARRGEIPITLTLVHLLDGEEQRRWQWERPADGSVDQEIDLRPGENVLRLTAVAADAPPSEAARETSVVERLVDYQPQAPTLGLAAVAAAGARRVFSLDDEPWLVDGPAIRIEGTAASTDKLAAAEWKWSDEDKWRPFAGFKPGQSEELSVDEAIALTAGRARLECRVVAQGKPAAETRRAMTFDYRPKLPDVKSVAISPERLIEGADPLEIALSGVLSSTEDPRDFRLEVYRDGDPLGIQLGFDGRLDFEGPTKKFTMKAPVSPTAANRFQLRLSNDWRSRWIAVPAATVLRPPRIGGVQAPAKARAAHFNLRFWVESPNHLELREIKVGETPWPLESAAVERRGPETTRWRVEAKDVPLRQGPNRLAISARNADGWTAAPPAVEIELEAPPPPLADIAFDLPMPGETFATPRCDVSFRVTSSSRLKRVALLGDNLPLLEVDVAQQVAGQQGGFTLSGEAAAPLPAARPHVLSVLAINEGGERRSQRSVVYLPPPVELLIDGIDFADNAARLVPDVLDGALKFDGPAPAGEGWLRGRVRWASSANPQLRQAARVEVGVNGFRQLSAALSPAAAGARERTWKARLCLNRPRGNRVEVSIPSLASDVSNQLSFEVDCAAPIERRRLHLLVVGVGSVDGEQLEAEALSAVHGSLIEQADSLGALKRFKTDVFPEGRLYRPTVREIGPQQLIGYIRRVLFLIKKANADAGADLFLLYYRGAEAIDQSGQFYLLTSLSEFNSDPEASGVSGDEMASMFRESPGAQLCLLDVERGARLMPSRGEDRNLFDAGRRQAIHTGMLRCVWLRPDRRPDDTLLLVAFGQATTTRSRLADIRAEIDKVYQGLRQRYPDGLRLEAQIPPNLRDLVLGQP